MEFGVRDYELDCEQIVNNANYLHYMEHTRHSFCEEAGLSFIEMHRRGIDPVVTKVEIEYKSSLRGGDRFISCLWIERKGPRFIFHQDIIGCVFQSGFHRQKCRLARGKVLYVAVRVHGRAARG